MLCVSQPGAYLREAINYIREFAAMNSVHLQYGAALNVVVSPKKGNST